MRSPPLSEAKMNLSFIHKYAKIVMYAARPQLGFFPFLERSAWGRNCFALHCFAFLCLRHMLQFTCYTSTCHAFLSGRGKRVTCYCSLCFPFSSPYYAAGFPNFSIPQCRNSPMPQFPNSQFRNFRDPQFPNSPIFKFPISPLAFPCFPSLSW